MLLKLQPCILLLAKLMHCETDFLESRETPDIHVGSWSFVILKASLLFTNNLPNQYVIHAGMHVSAAFSAQSKQKTRIHVP